MAKSKAMVIVIIKKGKLKTITKCPILGKKRIVVIVNNQFTNAPNTTQIASGAGRNSASGSNAAIDSSNTGQQQSVGAGGKAKNIGIKGKQVEPLHKKGKRHEDDEVVVVVNNQTVKLRKSGAAGATQVASGGGKDSAGGTNAAVDSVNTKQQQAVGGGKGAEALNKGLKGKQKEKGKRK